MEIKNQASPDRVGAEALVPWRPASPGAPENLKKEKPVGNLFSQKCDLCGKIQTEEDHSRIKGTGYVMSGVAQFACGECAGILHTAFSVGVGGLREPMLELAKVVKERDQYRRLLEQSGVQREEGTVALVGVELDHMRMQQMPPELRFRPANPVLGQHIPIAGAHRIGQAPTEQKHRIENKPTKAPEKQKGIMGKLGFKKKPK
jgi:hypothetical protein